MRVLGVRNAPKVIRYVILDGNRDEFKFLNKESENKITFPKSITEDVEKVKWVYEEIQRIVEQYGSFDMISIKQNENTRTTYSKLKFTAFLDGLFYLISAQKNINLVSYLYNQLGTNSKQVEEKAGDLVGKTKTYWDRQIADAVIAAWRTLGDKS